MLYLKLRRLLGIFLTSKETGLQFDFFDAKSGEVLLQIFKGDDVAVWNLDFDVSKDHIVFLLNSSPLKTVQGVDQSVVLGNSDIRQEFSRVLLLDGGDAFLMKKVINSKSVLLKTIRLILISVYGPKVNFVSALNAY